MASGKKGARTTSAILAVGSHWMCAKWGRLSWGLLCGRGQGVRRGKVSWDKDGWKRRRAGLERGRRGQGVWRYRKDRENMVGGGGGDDVYGMGGSRAEDGGSVGEMG